jgi:hypothetical protein
VPYLNVEWRLPGGSASGALALRLRPLVGMLTALAVFVV